LLLGQDRQRRSGELVFAANFLESREFFPSLILDNCVCGAVPAPESHASHSRNPDPPPLFILPLEWVLASVNLIIVSGLSPKSAETNAAPTNNVHAGKGKKSNLA
jgi:hypothetical protein